MKLKNIPTAIIIALILTACGGGGSSDSTGSAPTATPAAPPSAPTVPVAPPSTTAPVPGPTRPIDPYTNQPTTADAATSLSGMVVSNVTSGAVVTAFAVQSDGKNGIELGKSAPTGADGKFTVLLSSAPSGMVRLVANGGQFTSEADNTTQANTALELVTPYVTTDTNFFVITPVTHIVSQLVAYRAGNGASLAAAYTGGASAVVGFSAPNVLLKDDARAGINILKTIPGSADDTLNTYQDVLTAFEWYGVKYDLPSNVVLRALAAAAEGDFPQAGVDGKGSAINLGNWNGNFFDPSLPRTLGDLTTQKNIDGTDVTIKGVAVHDETRSFISTNLIQYSYRVAACSDDKAKAALFTRYPNSPALFSDPNVATSICAANTKEMMELKNKIALNRRGKH